MLNIDFLHTFSHEEHSLLLGLWGEFLITII
jgi:hypothetical protein